MKDFKQYETIGSFVFDPYLPGKGPVFVLTTWDTYRRDSLGKCVLAYRLAMGEHGQETILFEGEDFACSPMHAIDSNEAIASLMWFLTLRPGDTDAEYFEGYTDAQRSYCEQHAEALSLEVLNRYGDPPLAFFGRAV